ncbi:MAG: ATP-binding protein [Methylococcales bacterium]
MAVNFSIRSKLLLLGIVPAFVVALALSSYFIYHQISGNESRLIERGNVIAGQLATLASNTLSRQGVQLTQSVVNAIIQEDDVIEATVFDRNGNLIARASSSTAPVISTQELLVFSALIVGPPDALTVDASPSRADRSISPSLGSYGAQKSMGHVQLSLTRETILRDRDKILLTALAITLTGLLITAILAYGFGQRISKPISKLANTVLALTHGKLETRVQFSSSGQLEQLKTGVNALADQLQKHQESADQRVYQATVRLQSALKSTELQNAELKKARRHAELENQNKSRFLAQVSHEIRTPMNGIIGFTEILSKSSLSPSQDDQLKLIERSAKNLLGIINEILDLSRLEAGKAELHVTSFSLRPYLEDAVVLLRPQSTETQIILSIEPNLPKTITSDPAKVQQITVNLLGNAIKFTRKGRIIIRTRCRDLNGQKTLLMTVSDNGRGINEEGLAKLFVPFSQITEKQDLHQQGTGLGLSISKSFVTQVGGHMGVISRPKVGSTFWVSIPIDSLSEKAPELTDFNIGLIDPCPLTANALTYQLNDLKAKVTLFPSLNVFLESAHNNPCPPIVILNLSNPKVDNVKEVSSWYDLAKSLGLKPLVILSHPQVGVLEGVLQMLGIPSLVTPCRSEYLLQTLKSLDLKKDSLPNNRLIQKPNIETLKPVQPIASISNGNTALKFLVADDNEINRLLIINQLESTGAIIIEAENGEKALSIAQSTSFDMIFLDLQMPLLDGVEVLKRIRNDVGLNAQTPAIAITAHAMEDERKSLIAEGFEECLIKPIFQKQVNTLINRFLNKDIGEPSQQEESSQQKEPSPEKEPPIVVQEYVTKLLRHTNENRTLAETIIKKLIDELPHQISVIENALDHHKLETATSITHKLHGSFSFCGFTDLKQSAETVESHLIRGHEQKAKDAFSHLKEQIEELIEMESRFLGLLAHS